MSNDFINHLMLCKKCNGGQGRYCDEGKVLKIKSDAAFYAEAMAKLATKAEREAYMAKFYPKNYFDVPALNAEISRQYQEIKRSQKAA